MRLLLRLVGSKSGFAEFSTETQSNPLKISIESLAAHLHQPTRARDTRNAVPSKRSGNVCFPHHRTGQSRAARKKQPVSISIREHVASSDSRGRNHHGHYWAGKPCRFRPWRESTIQAGCQSNSEYRSYPALVEVAGLEGESVNEYRSGHCIRARSAACHFSDKQRTPECACFRRDGFDLTAA